MVIMIQDIDIQQLERQYSISSYNSAKDEVARGWQGSGGEGRERPEAGKGRRRGEGKGQKTEKPAILMRAFAV
jgi:hypothetical protein